MLADLAPAGIPLTADQVDALASQIGADVVITGLIHDYGKVRWQYWVTGLAVYSTTELLIVGFASGWNPAIVVPFFSLMWRQIRRFGTAVRMCSVGPFDRCGFVWRLYRYGTVEVLCGAKMNWRLKCRAKLWTIILQRNNQRRKFSWKPISSTSWRSSSRPSRRSLRYNPVKLTESRPRSVASVYGPFLTSCTKVARLVSHCARPESLPMPLKDSLVDPQVRASNEHLLSVRVPRAGGRPGCPLPPPLPISPHPIDNHLMHHCILA